MSDITATNCGCERDCGCNGNNGANLLSGNGGCGCNLLVWLILLSALSNNDGCGNGLGGDSCCWIILLLLCCGGCGGNGLF